MRDFKKFDPIAYTNALIDANLLHTVDEAWESWSTQVKSIMDQHAPLKSHRVKKKRSNPWVNRGILLLIYKRDDLHKEAIRTKDPNTYNQYRKCRNRVVKEIHKAKKSYYTNEINQTKSTKQMWKTLRGLLKSKSSEDSPIQPNEFNDFFH